MIEFENLTEDWAAVKLLPHHTGLPRAVWITENQGYPHDIRVKVSLLRSGRGSWLDAVSVSVRPSCEEIVPHGRQPQLSAGDLALVCRWIWPWPKLPRERPHNLTPLAPRLFSVLHRDWRNA